jgi:hypothetical protein
MMGTEAVTEIPLRFCSFHRRFYTYKLQARAEPAVVLVLDCASRLTALVVSGYAGAGGHEPLQSAGGVQLTPGIPGRCGGRCVLFGGRFD